MRIKDKEVIYFKFISERLSLPILNGYFEKKVSEKVKKVSEKVYDL